MFKVQRSVGEWIIVVIIALLLRALVSVALPFVEILPYSCFAVCMLFLAPGGIEAGVLTAYYLSSKKPWWQFIISYLFVLYLSLVITTPGIPPYDSILSYYFTVLIFFTQVVIPHMLLGITGAAWYRMYIQRNSLDWRKHIVLAVLISVILSIFSMTLSGSIFSGVQSRNYEDGYHYYFHRGFPITFSGIAQSNTKLPEHAVSLPYYTTYLYNNAYVRILNLPAAVLNYILLFLIAVPFSYAMIVVFQKKRDLAIVVTLLILVTLYQLFTWGAGV